MVSRVLGESWRIYRQRFGIMLFFSFLFFGLGYSLYYGAVQAVGWSIGKISLDFVHQLVRLAQGTPAEDLHIVNPVLAANDACFALPFWMIFMMVAAGLMLVYNLLAVPMGMGGLTALSTGAPGHITSRSVFSGVRQRYGKLLVTYLCAMVYGMGAGTALMVLYSIAGGMIAIAVPLIILASGATIAFGVVLITLAVLLILAGLLAVQVLSLFIFPAAVFDRHYHFKAVGTSIRMGWRHFFPVLGVKLVSVLIMGFVSLLLFGVLFAVAWAGPALPIYAPVWYGCVLCLVWPFDVIVNGVLYRHVQERDASAQAA